VYSGLKEYSETAGGASRSIDRIGQDGGCARCGHSEDDTYEFDLPLAKAQPREEYVPGKCPVCGAPVQMHLKRTASAIAPRS
jgi:hypothetical protein